MSDSPPPPLPASVDWPSKDVLLAAVESASAALLVIDSSGLIVLANAETERLFGFARDELLGESIEKLVPPRVRDLHRDHRSQFSIDAHRRAIGVAQDLTGQHKDGTEIPLEIGLDRLRVGGAEFVLATIVDVRRLKHVEETLRRTNAELQRSEARYRGLVEGSIQGILIHANGVVRLANRALANLLGVSSPDELMGRSIWPVIAPEDRAIVERDMRARLGGEAAPDRYALRIIRADGALIWVECIITIVSWEGERAILATMFDITEQKRAEGALRASEERFRQLAEHVKEGFVIVDLPARQLTYVNPAFEDIWGRAAADAIADAEQWFSAVHPDDQPRARLHQHDIENGRSTEGALRIFRPDGSVRWLRYRMFPITDADRAPVRLVGLVEDITDQRMQEEQFRQAQKMEAIGQLAGGIAHDFNNLLTAIQGYSELVLHELGPSHPSSADIGEIVKAAQSAATLTQRILAFSRRQILQPVVLDLNHVLHRVEPLIRRLIGEDIALVVNPTTPLTRVYADAGQIEQIVMNLAVNARDAMPHGGRLTIETANIVLDEEFVRRHRGATAGPHAMLAISDTGTGMDDATQSHLFEPFFTTKEPGKGTGLGLATVYGIVKQSGGSIWVYSELGLGSTFKIYLPAASAPSVTNHVPAPAAALPTGTETVLVVEDQAEVRAVVGETLRRQGYTVLEAHDGAEAITAAARHSGAIHLLFTDVVMPRMDGRRVARAVRTARPDVRVLYTSGYTDEVIVRHGVLDPGLAFLQKPFTSDALIRKVRDVLDAIDPPAV